MLRFPAEPNPSATSGDKGLLELLLTLIVAPSVRVNVPVLTVILPPSPCPGATAPVSGFRREKALANKPLLTPCTPPLNSIDSVALITKSPADDSKLTVPVEICPPSATNNLPVLIVTFPPLPAGGISEPETIELKPPGLKPSTSIS